MKRPTKYTVINNPLDDYDFSFRRCHAAEIGAYFFATVFLILISALFVCTEKDGWTVLSKNLHYPIGFFVPFFLMGLSMTYRIKRVKKIIENGKKTEGEVISYRRIRVNVRSGGISSKPNHTLLNIRFRDKGERECTISVGRKFPEKVLASPYCTVYILDDKVFVTGFILRKKGDPKISFELKE
ncbi:hypothetical protein [Ruminococcus albus]|uniref:Uncharacterized protein n=1 Tax=Ruminococcus albus TaxID=1264 RepID=A0A1I1NXI2_RUMAL|nr:hypothetical protein [Ruminococcus albus]SFC99433.1 hypothetical protein SAMN02910406_02834 [Ruminococcus albus]